MSTTALPRHAPPRRPSGRREPSFGAFRMGSVFDVEVRIDVSLLVVFALVTVNLGSGVLPAWHPTWPSGLRWLVALMAAFLFFASVLAHELSHAVVARANGMRVERITLFLFGGVAHLESQPPNPKAEFTMAIVGPLTSAVIGGAALALGALLAGPALAREAVGPEGTIAALHEVGPSATLLLWLGPVNLSLALFNLVPGFPLDGGRVFRSIVWAVTKDLMKATRFAAGAGQLFAWALIAVGVMNFFRGAPAQGLWLALIGWFLNNAARSSVRELVVRRALADVPVSRVMRTKVDVVAPSVSLDELVRDHFMMTDQSAFPVEEGGRLVGLVCLDDVRRVAQRDWGRTNVAAIMTPFERLSTLPPDAEAEVALEELARRDVDQIPVVEDDRFLGMVRRRDLLRFLALQGAGLRSAE